MKNIFILLSLSIVIFTGCEQDRSGTLTSKEAIFKALQKKHADLSDDDVCIDKCLLLNDLFIVGYFAHDKGCGNPCYFFKGKEVQLKKKTIKAILMNSDFEENNLMTIENYHKEVTNHYQQVLVNAPETFDLKKYNFAPPTTKMWKGMIISTMWIQEPAGMTSQAPVNFHLSTVIFELDGSFVKHKKTKQFAVTL